MPAAGWKPGLRPHCPSAKCRSRAYVEREPARSCAFEPGYSDPLLGLTNGRCRRDQNRRMGDRGLRVGMTAKDVTAARDRRLREDPEYRTAVQAVEAERLRRLAGLREAEK